MQTKPAQDSSGYWIRQSLGWGGYSFIGLCFAIHYNGWQPSLVVGYGLYALYSIGLTHLLHREIQRRQWFSLPFGRAFLRLAPSALAIGLIQTFLIACVSLVFDGRHSLLFDREAMLYVALSTTSMAALWVTFDVVLTSRLRHREKETQLQLALREAELRALEAQVNPHFLFNCLNSIRGLVVENPPQAQDMITRLANILRYNLHPGIVHTVPLSSEVEVVGDYLALESVRFEDRLRVKVSIAPGAGQIQVPSMLLQTLVENALKHGIASRPAGGDLLIRASVENGVVTVEVENPGQLGQAERGAVPERQGVGLTNTRERLRLLYGGRASLQLQNREGGRVVATVLIPCAV